MPPPDVPAYTVSAFELGASDRTFKLPSPLFIAVQEDPLSVLLKTPPPKVPAKTMEVDDVPKASVRTSVFVRPEFIKVQLDPESMVLKTPETKFVPVFAPAYTVAIFVGSTRKASMP